MQCASDTRRNSFPSPSSCAADRLRRPLGWAPGRGTGGLRLVCRRSLYTSAQIPNLNAVCGPSRRLVLARPAPELRFLFVLAPLIYARQQAEFPDRFGVEPMSVEGITVGPQLTLALPVSKRSRRNTKESGRLIYAKEVLEICGHRQCEVQRIKPYKTLQRSLGIALFCAGPNSYRGVQKVIVLEGSGRLGKALLNQRLPKGSTRRLLEGALTAGPRSRFQSGSNRRGGARDRASVQCMRRRRNAGISREPCVTATISTACRSAGVR